RCAWPVRWTSSALSVATRLPVQTLALDDRRNARRHVLEPPARAQRAGRLRLSELEEEHPLRRCQAGEHRLETLARVAPPGAAGVSTCLCPGSAATRTSTRSRPSVSFAACSSATWPLCGGSKAPPKSPI